MMPIQPKIGIKPHTTPQITANSCRNQCKIITPAGALCLVVDPKTVLQKEGCVSSLDYSWQKLQFKAVRIKEQSLVHGGCARPAFDHGFQLLPKRNFVFGYHSLLLRSFIPLEHITCTRCTELQQNSGECKQKK
jgi:hypothetical protein